MNRQGKFATLALLMALVLVGCGGGSGFDAPVATTPLTSSGDDEQAGGDEPAPQTSISVVPSLGAIVGRCIDNPG